MTAVPKGTQIYFNLDGETTQDLAISGLAAIGAHLACYFISDTQTGWVGLMGRVLHPDAGDFPAGVNPPSVVSSSYYISGGDDLDGMQVEPELSSGSAVLPGVTIECPRLCGTHC